ncbi:MAG: ribosome recycling factor [Candidatus Moranbacteria bacterium]|nr:ribosome recycling factor [Candidatus Moranbacteria bacterium]NTW45482.1 ribosome recycling factor [Candidatus Moranbacteria bacterium]
MSLIKDILEGGGGRFGAAVEHFRSEAAKLRTGRAHPSLVEDLLVDYYGTKTPVKQLASVSVPESRTILIQPWDISGLQAVADAIRVSDLGLNPADDGRVIRLSLPALTEDRRKELVRTLNARMEDARVSIRTTREELWKEIQQYEKEGLIGEDEKFSGKDELQKEVDRFNAELESVRRKKEEEIMTV